MKLLKVDRHKAMNYTDIMGPRGFDPLIKSDDKYEYYKNDKNIQFINDGWNILINPRYRPIFDEDEVSSVIIELEVPLDVVEWLK